MPRPTDNHQQISGREIGLPLVAVVGSIRTRSAQRIAWHSHEGLELIFLIDGGTAYQFQEHGMLSLNGGQFLLVPAGAPHRGKQDIRMPSTLCGFVFQSLGKLSVKNSIFTASDLRRLGKEMGASPPAVRSMSRDLRKLVTRLAELLQQYKQGDTSAEIKASLRAMICLIVVEASSLLKTRQKADATQVAAAAQAFLRAHHADPVQIPDLAAHLGLSRARMHEVFKAATGLSPNDFLQRYRIEVAREQLANPRRAITNIAMSTGFNSSQYFSKVFQKYCGMTPSEYRTSLCR
jgi:AraC-like DNA-binding protein